MVEYQFNLINYFLKPQIRAQTVCGWAVECLLHAREALGSFPSSDKRKGLPVLNV